MFNQGDNRACGGVENSYHTFGMATHIYLDKDGLRTRGNSGKCGF